MARFSSVLLLIIGLYHAVNCEGNDRGEAMENVQNKRFELDIATILEDVKVLLADSQYRNDALSNKPPPRCSSSSMSTASSSCLAQDCQDGTAAVSGLATVYLSDPLSAFFQPIATSVYCDQETAGGGWLLLMRRRDNQENFPDRSYEDYARGFGNVAESFWLGLESMYRLTSDPGKEVATLRVELEDWEGERRYAQYSYFRVSSGTDGYRMFVSGFSGDAGNSLTFNSGQRFSTKVQDQDAATGNCAKTHNGAWWHKRCSFSCLTGEYIHGAHTDKKWQGVLWKHWRGINYSYKIAEMKIRFPSKQNP